DAIDSMIALTNVAEKEMSAEILLEAKGFTDAVVSMSDGSVDVVVSAGELTDAQRAQIEDIVKRKTGVEAANIIITAI
ncbi:MAG: SpoIIIAH-like family protein, partial [Lachnospiraceae bacterium]